MFETEEPSNSTAAARPVSPRVPTSVAMTEAYERLSTDERDFIREALSTYSPAAGTTLGGSKVPPIGKAQRKKHHKRALKNFFRSGEAPPIL